MQSNLTSITCSALPTIQKRVIIIKVVIHTSHWYLSSTLDIHPRHLDLTSTLNINTETYTIHLNRDIHNPISNTSSNFSDSSNITIQSTLLFLTVREFTIGGHNQTPHAKPHLTPSHLSTLFDNHL